MLTTLIRSIEDERLASRLVEEQIPLTVCPLSNVKLRVFSDLKSHNLKLLLDRGLLVTVNSDDPAYFRAYMNENLRALHEEGGMSMTEIVQLVRNSFEVAWLDDARRNDYLARLRRHVDGQPSAQ